MDGLTERELEDFMSGYFAAMRGLPLDPHTTPAWRDGFAFRLQVMSEKAERDECKTLH
jgi:hypothetical protein